MTDDEFRAFMARDADRRMNLWVKGHPAPGHTAWRYNPARRLLAGPDARLFVYSHLDSRNDVAASLRAWRQSARRFFVPDAGG